VYLVGQLRPLLMDSRPAAAEPLEV
jgi:hypothetical protein